MNDTAWNEACVARDKSNDAWDKACANWQLARVAFDKADARWKNACAGREAYQEEVKAGR